MSRELSRQVGGFACRCQGRGRERGRGAQGYGVFGAGGELDWGRGRSEEDGVEFFHGVVEVGFFLWLGIFFSCLG